MNNRWLAITLLASVCLSGTFLPSRPASADDGDSLGQTDQRRPSSTWVALDPADPGSGWMPLIALNRGGRPVVAYRHERTGRLKVLVCGDTVCSKGNTIRTPFAGGYSVGETKVALSSTGLPVISFGNSTNQSLSLLVCENAACDSGNSLVLVALDAHLGTLALDSDDRPVLVYRSNSDATVNVFTCGDRTCSTGNVRTVVDDGIAGPFSMQLDSAGRPIVAYFVSAPYYDLRVLACGNKTCTAGNSVASPYTDGWVGSYPSLRLARHGLPVVAFYGNDGQLTILRCGSRSCDSGNVTTVPEGAGSGLLNQLALDHQVRPSVVYYDREHVRLLVCGDSLCARGNVVTNLALLPGIGLEFMAAAHRHGHDRAIAIYVPRVGPHLLRCRTITCG